jgi:LysB family phage lysis regulatory protein
MNAIAVRLVAGVLALAALVCAWQYVRVLRAELVSAQADASNAKETVGRRDATITQLQKTEREHAAQLAQLEAKRAKVASTLTARETELETLKRENETVRAWASGDLPDDVVRMYTSPAIVGADAYIDDMLAGDAVRSAGRQPAKE